MIGLRSLAGLCSDLRAGDSDLRAGDSVCTCLATLLLSCRREGQGRQYRFCVVCIPERAGCFQLITFQRPGSTDQLQYLDQRVLPLRSQSM